MGKYVVYVNRPNNKAFIHLTSCHSYRNREPVDASGYWSKEFEKLKDAEDFADGKHKKHVRPCYVCIGKS